MPLIKLAFKPGINREGTSYSNEGGWYDGNLIRFRSGYVERMGGWAKANSNTFEGTVRKLHDFVTLSSANLLFMGSNEKVYLEYMKQKYPDLKYPTFEMIDLVEYFKKEPITIQFFCL